MAKQKDEDQEDDSVDLSNTIENFIRFLNELSLKIDYEGQVSSFYYLLVIN